MTLKIKRLREVGLPSYATPGSAAMDLRAAIDEPITLAPGGRATVPTGIAIELPSAEYVALVFARSGLAVKSGVTLSNAVGVLHKTCFMRSALFLQPPFFTDEAYQLTEQTKNNTQPFLFAMITV